MRLTMGIISVIGALLGLASGYTMMQTGDKQWLIGFFISMGMTGVFGIVYMLMGKKKDG